MVLFASFKTTAEQVQAADIGDISELNGSAQIGSLLYKVMMKL